MVKMRRAMHTRTCRNDCHAIIPRRTKTQPPFPRQKVPRGNAAGFGPATPPPLCASTKKRACCQFDADRIRTPSQRVSTRPFTRTPTPPPEKRWPWPPEETAPWRECQKIPHFVVEPASNYLCCKAFLVNQNREAAIVFQKIYTITRKRKFLNPHFFQFQRALRVSRSSSSVTFGGFSN